MSKPYAPRDYDPETGLTWDERHERDLVDELNARDNAVAWLRAA